MKDRTSQKWISAVSSWILLLSLFFLPKQVYAGGITVSSNGAKVDFPHSITFVLSARGEANIDRVTFIYGVSAESCLNSRARHDMIFDPSPSVRLEWTWDLFRSGDLPPGVEVWWQWEIHADDGSDTITEVQRLTIEDPNFDWKSATSGQISLYWAGGTREFGEGMLNIATASLHRLSETSNLSPSGNIRITVYPSDKDLQASLNHTTDWMGGVAFSEYNIVMIEVPPDSTMSWPKEVIPHELAHLIFDQRTSNCLGRKEPPSWLNEGFAMYAEGPVVDADREPVLAALEKGTLQPFTSIANGFPADASRANLAYAQSKMMVDFLIETYGMEKFETLLDRFQEGEEVNDAFRAVYGLDTPGLDQALRASLGFGVAPEPDFSTPTVPPRATSAPTMALFSPLRKASASPTAAAPTMEPTPEPSNPPQVAAAATSSLQETGVPGEQGIESPAVSRGLTDRWWARLLLAGLIFIVFVTAGIMLFAVLRKKNKI